jgi:hypothetical protein
MRFQVLGISRDRVALFEGDRTEIHALDIPGVPVSRAEALTDLQFHTALTGPGARGDVVRDGHGATKPEALPHVHQFFLAVDRAVIDLVSNPSRLPMVLTGVEENLSEFRGLTKNHYLTAESVRGDWTHWSLPEIREKAWAVVKNRQLEQLTTLREDFGTASARGLATSDVREAAAAAVFGRIGTLLVAEGRQAPGSIDPATGAVVPDGENLFDALAEAAATHGAAVHVVPSDLVPTASGVAAIFRY